MLKLRNATSKDTELLVQYIKELADFEKLSTECHVTPDLIQKWLFGDKVRAECLLVEWDEKPAGFVLYFYTFSTFLAKPSIYIEDLFIRPDFRRKGIARKILQHLANKALSEGCGRLEWSVLDWNKDAIAFYESIGAIQMNEWIVQRMTGDALEKLANSAV
ncbi:MAG: GNAT family N-acetyltransferase [Pseudomonadota bacterium]